MAWAVLHLVCLAFIGAAGILFLNFLLHTQIFLQSPATRVFGASREIYLDHRKDLNSTLNDATDFAASNQPDRMIHNGWLVRPLPGRIVPFTDESCRSSIVHVAVIGAMKAETTDFVKKMMR